MSELILCPVQSNIAVGVILRDVFDFWRRRTEEDAEKDVAEHRRKILKERENVSDL